MAFFFFFCAAREFDIQWVLYKKIGKMLVTYIMCIYT